MAYYVIIIAKLKCPGIPIKRKLHIQAWKYSILIRKKIIFFDVRVVQ